MNIALSSVRIRRRCWEIHKWSIFEWFMMEAWLFSSSVMAELFRSYIPYTLKDFHSLALKSLCMLVTKRIPAPREVNLCLGKRYQVLADLEAWTLLDRELGNIIPRCENTHRFPRDHRSQGTERTLYQKMSMMLAIREKEHITCAPQLL